MSVTCNPDLTAYNLFWEDRPTLDAGTHASAPQLCADWDALAGWMNSRAFPRRELAEMSGITYNHEKSTRA